MRNLRWPLTGVAIAVMASPCFADTIVLKNGRMITGKVLRESEDSLTVEVLDGQGRMTIHRATVAKVYKGNEAAPVPKQGIFPAKGPAPVTFTDVKSADVKIALASKNDATSGLGAAATSDLEARLRALGPSREDLLAQLQPTPEEAEELAKLARKLASGSSRDVAALAARGRLALMVAARALTAPDRAERTGAAQVIAKLAKDERTLPFMIALAIPEKLIEAAADEKEAASPVARQQARIALEAIARTEPCECPAATTVAMTANEKEKLATWRGWWQKEQDELATWERQKDEERAQIRAELARRGLKQYSDKRGRIEVRLAAVDEPRLPEPKLVLPRLVVVPPSAVRIESSGGERVLRFATIIENRGEGALEVRRSGVDDKESRAVQRVFARYPGDEKIVVEHETTVGTFVLHEGHGHYHLSPFARYELLDETFAPALGTKPAEKVSFCLRDSQPIAGGTGEGRYTECGRELQGISPGFADVYKDDLPDQEIAIGDLADGVYYLVNALTATFESASTAEDRVSAVKVKIAGGEVKVLAKLDGRALATAEARRREALGSK